MTMFDPIKLRSMAEELKGPNGSELRAALLQAAADAADAARYRYIRRKGAWREDRAVLGAIGPVYITVSPDGQKQPYQGQAIDTEELDAAIDAFLKERRL